MKRSFISTLVFLSLTNLSCTQHGISPALSAKSVVQLPFACESAARQQKFVGSAVKMGLSKKNALDLYQLSGADTKDVVTGFDPAEDRIPTVERAVKRTIKSESDSAFYVEVDIRNLGGLNQNLGHIGADEIYRSMSKIAESNIIALKANSCSFRYGGDEFSFVIVGPGITKKLVEQALAEADRKIQVYIADKGLADIKHPKHPNNPLKRGAGIIFGVSQIKGQADVKEIFSAADKVVEQKKLR